MENTNEKIEGMFDYLDDVNDNFLKVESESSLKQKQNDISDLFDNLIQEVADDNINAFDAGIFFKVIKDKTDESQKMIRSYLQDEYDKHGEKTVSHQGAKISIRSGYETLDYKENEEYMALKERIKQIENNMKIAYKQGKEFTDINGEIYEPAKYKGSVANSIIIKIK